MERPLISVVLPTRNRAEYLKYSLLTCLNQNYTDYEVVVFDNASEPSAKGVVDSVGDPRVRYYRSDQPLHMTNSWETALGHAKGEYVLFIGDDDGLMVDGIPRLAELVSSTHAKLVRWNWVSYYWPGLRIRDELSNVLRLPLLSNRAYRMSAQQILRDVISFRNDYSTLPMLYNSAAHRSLIDEVIRRTGRFFHSMSPDVGSGTALSYVQDDLLNVEMPLTIVGISQKSGGMAFCTGADTESTREFVQLGQQQQLTFHPAASSVRCLYAAVADSFFTVKQVLFPEDTTLVLDRRKLIDTIIAKVPVASDLDATQMLSRLRQSVQDDPALVRWFERKYKDGSCVARASPVTSGRRLGYNRNVLSVDCSEFGVSDVDGAAQLAERILNYRHGGFNAKLSLYQLPWRARMRKCAKVLALGDRPVLFT